MQNNLKEFLLCEMHNPPQVGVFLFYNKGKITSQTGWELKIKNQYVLEESLNSLTADGFNIQKINKNIYQVIFNNEY